ncbi:MAG: glycosyltransferase [Caldilineaceae bacterium]
MNDTYPAPPAAGGRQLKPFQVARPLNIVILGLSITSSWGNGHATTYRALVRALVQRGHRVLFLERNMPWYAENRDLPNPPYGCTELYTDLDELKTRFEGPVATADLVIVGSYVPDGVAAGDWVLATAMGVPAFYDIDTPITLSKLEHGDYEYLAPHQIGRYALYLSFAGGRVLEQLEQVYHSPAARPLYCAVDPDLYYPERHDLQWDLGYMGTYSPDRQPGLDRLLLEPARQLHERHFVVAGPNFPLVESWPGNVKHFTHLAPDRHRAFYNEQRFTLNLTRAAMAAVGFSPSVRLFEAGACGVPIISDTWEGLDTFFAPGEEILVAASPADVTEMIQDIPETQRAAIGARARAAVLARHTAAHRALELESYVAEVGVSVAQAGQVTAAPATSTAAARAHERGF